MSIASNPRYLFPNSQVIIDYCNDHYLIKQINHDIIKKIIKPIALMFANEAETQDAIEVGIVAVLATSRTLSQEKYEEHFNRLSAIFREVLFELLHIPKKSS